MTTKTIDTKIGALSKVFLLVSGACLIISIFYPIWRIDLDAPQYPEGLALLIYADKLGGQVDIINGLNHYIGMKTLHAEEFVEFTVLPYIIGTYALACLAVIFIARKKALYLLLWAFVLFGIVAMADFWRWEYNYGHNLDPKAAIIVPGMAYQPPLIGYKKLLNFGAYSVPDLGGWLFVVAGLLLATASFLEFRIKKLPKGKAALAVLPFFFFSFTACFSSKSEPVKLNSDKCVNCGMTISDPRFVAELITQKGRVYKFDDISCMFEYKKANSSKMKEPTQFIADFLGNHHFMKAETAFYIKGEAIKSPMRGNVAAFGHKDSATVYAIKFKAQQTQFKALDK